MEFLPSTQDLSSPKATLIQSSLAFVVLTAIGVRFWMRRSFMAQRLPAAKAEAFTMVSKDFGDVAETRRDASRSFAGGGIYLQLPRDADGDTFLLKLEPPEGSSSGVDKETVEANIKAFAAELRSQLSALTITDAHVQRILPSKCKATKTRAGSQALRSRPDAQIVCVSTSCVCDSRCSRSSSAHRQSSCQRARCRRQSADAQR